MRIGKASIFFWFFLIGGSAFSEGRTSATSEESEIFSALVNGRSKGCLKLPGTNVELKRDTVFDAVSMWLARGKSIDDAMRLAGTKPKGGAHIFIPKQRTKVAFFEMAVRAFCNDLVRPDFNKIGIFIDQKGAWLHIGQVFLAPRDEDLESILQRGLDRINLVRSQGRSCGEKWFQAAPALKPSGALNRAARAHALDMASNKYYSHIGRDGSTAQDRAQRAGYPSRFVAENNDAGSENIDEAILGWTKSPGHCATLMQTDLTEVGFGYSVNLEYYKGVFWVKLLGNPEK